MSNDEPGARVSGGPDLAAGRKVAAAREVAAARGLAAAARVRTRGGWAPAGTAAARRVAHGERTTAKGLRTRDELVTAARLVFERDGYTCARVADIAAEAGVAHGSFYTYFSSKQDAFLAVMRDVVARFSEAIAAPPGEVRADAYQALDRSNRRYLDAYRANSVIWALAEQVATVDPEIHEIRLRGRRQHVDRVAKTIRRWQARGIADPAIDPETTAGALVSMLSNFAYWWLAGGDSYDPEAAAATLTSIWARAVGLPHPA
jgi:AcrR family transcriptional regulator